jgi:hypothetical protein
VTTAVDLTIRPSDADIVRALASWRWLLDRPLQPIFASKFGDVFFFDQSGRVLMLSMLDGELVEIAPSSDAFNAAKRTPEKQQEWFLDAFVFRCEREGNTLGPGQCYAFLPPPICGGKIAFENIQVFDFVVHVHSLGQIHAQMRGIVP